VTSVRRPSPPRPGPRRPGPLLSPLLSEETPTPHRGTGRLRRAASGLAAIRPVGCPVPQFYSPVRRRPSLHGSGMTGLSTRRSRSSRGTGHGWGPWLLVFDLVLALTTRLRREVFTPVVSALRAVVAPTRSPRSSHVSNATDADHFRVKEIKTAVSQPLYTS
jgi:hypothetical protein